MASPEFFLTVSELTRYGFLFLAIVVNIVGSGKKKKWILYPQSTDEKHVLEEVAEPHGLTVSTAIPVLEGGLPYKLVISDWITAVQIAISLREKNHPAEVGIIRPR